MSSVIPPAVQAGLDRIAERLERYLAAQSALRYIQCRKNGGSMEECMGIFRITAPPLGDPFFSELLNNVEAAEQHRLLTAVKYQLLEDVEGIDESLKALDV